MDCFVLISSTLVSNQSDTYSNFLEHIGQQCEVVKHTTLVLDPQSKQAQSLSIENRDEFFRGNCSALWVRSNDIESVVAGSPDPGSCFIAEDAVDKVQIQRIFFPQQRSLDKGLVIVKPMLNPEQADALVADFGQCLIFTLRTGTTDLAPNHAEICSAPDLQGDISFFLFEGMDSLKEMELVLGRAQDDGSCRNKFPDHTFWSPSSSQQANQIIQAIFLDPLPTERTYAMIKPHAVAQGHVDEILRTIENHGFTIISHKQLQMQLKHAQQFYNEHSGRPFFGELTQFMSSGPVHALVLEKPNAIKCWRTLLGPTNTFTAKEAAPKCLRARFGADQTRNAAHGSDSEESAEREIRFFFPELYGSSLNHAETVEEYFGKPLTENDPTTLNQFLIQGLTELAKVKPGSDLEVVEWLGKWFLENNPNKGQVEEPEDELDVRPFVEKLKSVNNGHEIHVVFVLGGPGSGKGTQCERLVSNYGFVHLSAGDLLRNILNADEENVNPEKKELSEQIRETMANGKLVSSELIISLLSQAMLDAKGSRYLIDGFPREIEQAILFEQNLIPCEFALYFDAPASVLTERCLKRGESSGRVDDNEETVTKRLNTFYEASLPVVEHMESFGKCLRIDATQDIDDVWGNVVKTLDSVEWLKQ